MTTILFHIYQFFFLFSEVTQEDAHSFLLTLIYLDICVIKKHDGFLCPSVYILQLLKVFREVLYLCFNLYLFGSGYNVLFILLLSSFRIVKKLQCKQASVTTITEKVDELTKKQESPEHKEISHLNDQWLDLCLHSNNLLQREEDLQRTRDYHDRMNVVEGF